MQSVDNNHDHMHNCKGPDRNHLLRAEELLEHLWMVVLGLDSPILCMCMDLEDNIQSCNRKSIVQHSSQAPFQRYRSHCPRAVVAEVVEGVVEEDGRAAAAVAAGMKVEEERELG